MLLKAKRTTRSAVPGAPRRGCRARRSAVGYAIREIEEHDDNDQDDDPSEEAELPPRGQGKAPCATARDQQQEEERSAYQYEKTARIADVHEVDDPMSRPTRWRRPAR